MMRRRSLPRLLLVGMIFSAVPAMSLARQSFAAPEMVQLILPVMLSKTGADISALTEINTLQLSELAGAKDMAVGDVVYIHLNIAKDVADPALRSIRYPYAISQNRPQRSDENTISLRGIVTSREADTIAIKYLFETLPYHKRLMEALPFQAQTRGDIVLNVNRRAVGHVKSIIISGKDFPVR